MDKNVSLIINVCRTDTIDIAKTIPSIVRGCNYPLLEVIVFYDTSEPIRKYRSRICGTPTELVGICKKLQKDRIITDARPIDFSPRLRKKIYKKYFGHDLKQTNCKSTGSAIYQYLYANEQARGDYVVHTDCDMIFYRDENYSWVKDAMDFLDTVPKAMFVNPMEGPPSDSGLLTEYYVREFRHAKKDTYYQFDEFFSVRTYMYKKEKLEGFIPFRTWVSDTYPLRRIWLRLRGFELILLEQHISYSLSKSDYFRAQLSTPKCWSLHPLERNNPIYIENLYKIISLIHKGIYPESQKGMYDLLLAEYERYLL